MHGRFTARLVAQLNVRLQNESLSSRQHPSPQNAHLLAMLNSAGGNKYALIPAVILNLF